MDSSSANSMASDDLFDDVEGRLIGGEPKDDRISNIKERSSSGRNIGAFKVYTFDASVEKLERNVTERHLDHAIDSVVPMAIGDSKSKVIRSFHPQKSWLWRQWYGTLWHHGYKNILFMMIYTFAVSFALPYIEDVSKKHFGQGLDSLTHVFQYLMTLAIFILTFFLNQSYGLWRDIYNGCRALQGHTDDLGFLAATHAARDEIGEYTEDARVVLKDIAMSVKLFHIFVYASKTRRYRVLHTKRAIKKMVARGVLSQDMCDALLKMQLYHNDRVFGMIEWILLRFKAGMKNGTLSEDLPSEGFLGHVTDRCLDLRKDYSSFRYTLEARIPLAYAHFVQVMVDALLFTAPFALFKELGMFAIPTVGIMTAFFSGLLDISKIMLDPFDNEDFCEGVIDINVGVFIRQANYGAVKFRDGGEFLPKGWLE
jgi:predicted membrane chloride channel (bestrophin family)